jgi:hypothetical protein
MQNRRGGRKLFIASLNHRPFNTFKPSFPRLYFFLPSSDLSFRCSMYLPICSLESLVIRLNYRCRRRCPLTTLASNHHDSQQQASTGSGNKWGEAADGKKKTDRKEIRRQKWGKTQQQSIVFIVSFLSPFQVFRAAAAAPHWSETLSCIPPLPPSRHRNEAANYS